MEQNEFRIDKNKVLTKEYLLDQINPGNAIPYVRNSLGTLMVDSNSSNINSERLVINLVNTRYKLLSFNNVLKTNFEEFLDPEITVPDEQQTGAQDQSGTILDLTNQVNNKDQIIDNLNKTIDALTTTLANTSSGSAAEAIDVAALINETLTSAATANNKKPRIFADGTLLRDKNNTAFFYIVEDGKKRWFQWNIELLNIVAKSLGKIKSDGGVDLIDVSQDVLDDIPEGAPFTNFDLVKNTQTPAPPPLDLGGKRLTAKWINKPNPYIIYTTNTTPTDSELLLSDLQLQVASAEGIVNNIEVWEESPYRPGWYPGKPQLPIMGMETNATWWRAKITGFQEGVDTFKVMIRKTWDPVWDKFTSNEFNLTGNNLLDAYYKPQLSIDEPEWRLFLTAKIFNDVNDEYYQVPEDRLEVIIRYVSKMPNVINLTEADAKNAITSTGIPASKISTSTVLTANSSLYGKVQSSDPVVNSNITKDSDIQLVIYKGGVITVPNSITYVSRFSDVVRALKRAGFNNIQVGQIYRTGYTTQDMSVSAILKQGNTTLTPNSTYLFSDPIYLKVNIWNDGRLINFTRNVNVPDNILISYLNNLITSIV